MIHATLDTDYDTFSILSPGDELIEFYWGSMGPEVDGLKMYDEAILHGGPLKEPTVYVRIAYPRNILIKKSLLLISPREPCTLSYHRDLWAKGVGECSVCGLHIRGPVRRR